MEVFMVLCGSVWYCVVLYGAAWKCLWYCVVVYGSVWYCMVLQCLVQHSAQCMVQYSVCRTLQNATTVHHYDLIVTTFNHIYHD